MSERDRDGYYSLLGLAPDATPDQVKAAYESALKAAAEQPGMSFISKAAEQAYSVLSDSSSRANYDSSWTQPTTQTTRAFVGSEGDAEEPDGGWPGAASRMTLASGLSSGSKSARSGWYPKTAYNPVRDPLGYYQLLGVSMDAEEAEIYTIYHFTYTLNKQDAFPPERRMAAKTAYEVLVDPERRAQYDPAWLFPSNRLHGIHGELYHQYLSRGGTPYSLSNPLPQSSLNRKPWGCAGVFVFLTVATVLCV
jgi:DnaJ-class molecular chaperone